MTGDSEAKTSARDDLMLICKLAEIIRNARAEIQPR
jgi:hypothetical protein